MIQIFSYAAEQAERVRKEAEEQEQSIIQARKASASALLSNLQQQVDLAATRTTADLNDKAGERRLGGSSS